MSFEISEYEGYEVKTKAKKVIKKQVEEKPEEIAQDEEDSKKED